MYIAISIYTSNATYSNQSQRLMVNWAYRYILFKDSIIILFSVIEIAFGSISAENQVPIGPVSVKLIGLSNRLLHAHTFNFIDYLSVLLHAFESCLLLPHKALFFCFFWFISNNPLEFWSATTSSSASRCVKSFLSLILCACRYTIFSLSLILLLLLFAFHKTQTMVVCVCVYVFHVLVFEDNSYTANITLCMYEENITMTTK